MRARGKNAHLATFYALPFRDIPVEMRRDPPAHRAEETIVVVPGEVRRTVYRSRDSCPAETRHATAGPSSGPEQHASHRFEAGRRGHPATIRRRKRETTPRNHGNIDCGRRRRRMTLELLDEGRGGGAIVVVPGFLTQDAQLDHWVTNLRLGRFAGDIWAVRWKSGSLTEMGGSAAEALISLERISCLVAAVSPPLVVGAVAPIAIAAGRRYWRSKVDLARKVAPEVRRDLLKLRRRYQYREITLIAHSLGVELTWAMLEGCRSLPADRFVLLGGASSATDGCWDELEIDADVYNVGHLGDLVLRFFYEAAERETPLGLADAGGQLINVDVGHLGLPGLGHDYGHVFVELDAPHRWRPSHFGA